MLPMKILLKGNALRAKTLKLSKDLTTIKKIGTVIKEWHSLIKHIEN